MVVTKTPNQTTLLPDRHPQHNLFICDVADAVLKDVIAQMEHPFYSLSKKPETKIRRHKRNGHWLEVTPSVKGLATIYDKDILIYCISQLVGAMKRGEEISQRIRITTRDLLVFTNRGTAGKDYTAICEAVERLAGTRISTNIRTGDEEQFDSFGLIEAASIRRKHGFDGRLLWVEIKVSDWVFNAIRAQEVLTLHRDYFRLRKPIERRIYELARKHCGRQDRWSVSVNALLAKSGSQSPLKRFRQMIQHLAKHDHLPDYRVEFDAAQDMVVFINRGSMLEDKGHPTYPILDLEVFHDARTAAPGYDVYQLERDWRAWWVDSGCPVLRSPEAAFIGFCKKRHANRPLG